VGRAQEDDPLGTLTRFGIVTLVVAAAAVLAVILLARGRGEAGGGVSSSGPVRVAATLDHRSVDFGDPVTAEVSVVVSQPGVRASDVSVREDLAPLTQLGGTRVTRTARGGRLVLTYTARASCLDERCIGGRAGKRIVLAPVVVHVRPGTTKAARWPALVVHTRVPAADVVKPVPPLRRDPTPRPVGYRVAPGSLALALEVAAAALAAAGVLLAGLTGAALVRRRRRAERLSELERALALAREAERRPPPDRRRALGLLARLLGPREPGLADAADELAWSAPAPTEGELSDLVSRVERKVNGS
jgi:hypothetical protein